MLRHFGNKRFIFMAAARAVPAERFFPGVFQIAFYGDDGNKVVAVALHGFLLKLTGKALEPYNKARPRRLRQQEAKRLPAASRYVMNCIAWKA